MLFCQFAKSQSLRDISNGLRSATGNLNDLAMNKAPSKSTIAYQNKIGVGSFLEITIMFY